MLDHIEMTAVADWLFNLVALASSLECGATFSTICPVDLDRCCYYRVNSKQKIQSHHWGQESAFFLSWALTWLAWIWLGIKRTWYILALTWREFHQLWASTLSESVCQALSNMFGKTQNPGYLSVTLKSFMNIKVQDLMLFNAHSLLHFLL